jgi:hypothetical protein
MAYVVKLKSDWPGSFRRNVVLGDGEIRELFFLPGVAVELDAEQFAGVKGDIGKALLSVDETPAVEESQPADKPAPERTSGRKRKNRG